MIGSVQLSSLLLPGLVLLVDTASALSSFATATRCQDNPRFRFQDVPIYDCQWIAAQNDGLCNWEVIATGEDDEEVDTPFAPFATLGDTQCPVSCGRCPRDVTETVVYTDDVCYDPRQSHSRNRKGVVVSFEIKDPQPQDWIGIYPVLTTGETLEIGSVLGDDLIAWSWACDVSSSGGVPNVHAVYDISTECKVEYNQVVFRYLPPGIYKVVLAHITDEIFATSHSYFEVLGPSTSGSELCAARKLESEQVDDGDEACLQLYADDSTYSVGQDIPIRLEKCKANSTHSKDFIAIYDADTDLEDIKGDANYHLWMWSCGSQFCHGDGDEAGTSGKSKDLVFGAESNKHTWPLPPGVYQAHLVKYLEDEGRFASVVQSDVFSVVEEQEEDMLHVDYKNRQLLLGDCLDSIQAKSRCYQEGESFAVLLRNECNLIGEEDWFGFFPADDCAEDNHICQGEPIMWSMACHEGDCHHGHAEFRFEGHWTGNTQDGKGGFVLPAGDYRLVLVDDEAEKGPYHARLMSTLPIQIQRDGESCHLIEQQT